MSSRNSPNGLDDAFFNPDTKRPGLFRQNPVIPCAFALSFGLLLYRIKLYRKLKATGGDLHFFVITSRMVVTVPFVVLVCVSSAFIDLQRKAEDAKKTPEQLHREKYRDYAPRKLPNQKIKPDLNNPLILMKTNILEEVLQKQFTAKRKTS